MTITLRRTADFDRWLTSLGDDRAQARIQTRLFRLTQGNPGDVEPIGNGLSELRINYGPGYRVYFGKRGTTLIVLLAGGDKRSQSRDIRHAKALWDIWQQEN